MAKQKRKTVLIIISMLMAFVLLYLYIAVILTPKDGFSRGGANFYRDTAIKTEERNSLDVIVLGNSDVEYSINPLQIFKDTGITTYNLGQAKNSPNGMKHQLKSVLKKQSPKVVVVDTSCFYLKNTAKRDLGFASFFVAPFKFHVRWKDLKPKDFITLPKYRSDDYKGFINAENVYPYTMPENYMGNMDSASPLAIEQSIKDDMKEIYTMCNQNNIKLVFVCIPVPMDWDEARSKGSQEFADELGVPYIDFNLVDKYISLDYSTSFKDAGGHVNNKGAKVISRYLSNYLPTVCNFEDKRTNPKYQKWNQLVNQYNYLLV